MDLTPFPACGATVIDAALAAVAAPDAATVIAGLALAGNAGLGPDEGQVVMTAALAAMLGWAQTPTRLRDALDVVASLPATMADVAFNLLIDASFPDGAPDLTRMSNAAVLLTARLVAGAGHPGNAIAVLAKAAAARPAAAFMPLAHVVRGHILGLASDLGALWTPLATPGGDVLDPQTHRALARQRVAEGDIAGALDALLTGASLPSPAAAKAGIGADLAALAVHRTAAGHDRWLGQEMRVRFALAATPTIATQAAAALADWAEVGAHALYGAGLRAPIADWFAGIAAAPPPPYPLRGARPHVDVVWLEITNHCNQKCSFCPDPHREAPRQWMPLAQVTALIDQLAEHVSVGALQLNAYGEPLLHPQIGEIIAHIRARQLPWPTFFTTHGLTLQPKKLEALSHNWPAGIFVSLHNDNQDSYARSRSAKIGDYDTLVGRLTDLLTQMVDEAAPCHVRAYQMVCNGNEDPRLPADLRAAFADSPERMARHVRKWEAIAARIAAAAPPERRARAIVQDEATIAAAFANADQTGGAMIPFLAWIDVDGAEQYAMLVTRAVSTYGNLVLEYDPGWTIRRQVVNAQRCGFVQLPSLAVFATGRLGICCLDLNSTGTFGHISEFAHLGEALRSDAARRIFAELSNNVATSAGCQVCLASGAQVCRIKE